jgi:hypothetical protein
VRGLRARLLALLGSVVLGVGSLAGCTTLPDSGAVHTRADSDAADQVPYFSPPGPVRGADPASVVDGFLLAIQANPPSTAVARSFLADEAKATWKPVQGTTVYDNSVLSADGSEVRARLTGAHQLDQRGGWLGGSTSTTADLGFSLVQQHGDWRIVNPPASLPVPISYFRSLYAPYTLYFYDRTGTVLVPTRVYLPRGEQIASNLVRGLLAGPGPDLARWTRSAVRPGTGLEGSVLTNEDGLAEVPFGPEIQRLSAPDLHRLVVQLAWTLRQVPGITALRVSADGVAITAPGGAAEVNLSGGLEYDPVSAPSTEALALDGGRVVRLGNGGPVPVDGPLGRAGFSLRSVAGSVGSHRIAAVSGNGVRLYVAPDVGATGATKVRPVLDAGTDLLRPEYDRFGRLWVLDATRAGAVVHVLAGGRDRVVPVPGITGRRVGSFFVTRDGARLVAATTGPDNPSLLVAGIMRAGAAGAVVKVLRAARVDVPGVDLGTVLDVGQDSATTAAVLTRSASGTRRIITVELDGSPGDQGGTPDPVSDPLVSLLVDPDPDLPRRAVSADGRLLELSGTGQWLRVASDVLTASYAQ